LLRITFHPNLNTVDPITTFLLATGILGCTMAGVRFTGRSTAQTHY
jgi:hypothetical protein